MASHSFSFEGGEELTALGASWFVSYVYYRNIDENHRNWDLVSDRRIGCHLYGPKYGKFWLSKVLEMNDKRLNTNKLGLKAFQIKQMATELLKLNGTLRY